MNMNRKKMIKALLIQGLVLLALGGWLLHMRIHSPMIDEDNLVPFISGIISILIVPFLFLNRKTLPLGYIINGFSVILGTIIMAHYSIVRFSGAVTFQGLFLNTTLADIALLWGKFAVGKAIFDLEFLRSDTDEASLTRYWKYPNSGWWFVHLFGWMIVYALGNILWR